MNGFFDAKDGANFIILLHCVDRVN